MKYLIISFIIYISIIIIGCSNNPSSVDTVEISIGTLNDNIVKYAIDINTGLIDTSTIKIIAGDSTGIKVPIDIEVNREHKIFVLNQGTLSIPPTITVFSAVAEGNARPELVIDISLLNFNPIGLALAEGTDFVFVSYFPTNPLDKPRIIRFNSTGSRSVFNIDASTLGDIELSTREAAIFAVDLLGRQILKLTLNSSFEIQPGPERIRGGNTGLLEPSSISLTTDGKIQVFNKRAGTDIGGIFIFPANSTGDIPPERVLWYYCDSVKTIYSPYGLAVAEFLNVKVILACSGNKLTTIPAQLNGCADPLQKIDIGTPVSVAFDKVRF